VIDSRKPYPAMKNSDVPWLGKVPQHWDVRRLKRLCSRSALYGANVPATEYKAGGVRFLRTTDITEEGRLKGHGVFLPRDVVREYILNDGDLLISRSGTIGRSFLYDRKQHGPCAYAGYLVRFVLTADAPPEYLFLFTKTQAFAGFLRVMAISSTIENVNGEKYGNCPLPLPPLPEQAAIVRFLDHADRRIRRYIRAKQKLIKLLEEQKQAIIHRAVTRGLDPNVRLKPSGVEWLGDLPEHWEVQRLGRITKVFNGTTPSRIEPAYSIKGTVPWLSSEKVNDFVIDTPSELVTERALQECSISVVPRGAVVIGLVGQGKTRAKSAFLGIDACINQNMAAIVVRDQLSSSYLHFFLTAFYKELREFGRGGNQEALNCEIVSNWRVAFPPFVDQDAISDAIWREIRGTQAADRRLRQEIDLLREYRTRLIADVVTGKLDVREAAAKLPHAEEDPEISDAADEPADDDEAALDDLDMEPDEAEA
jgi:type I restriction enzyme S subunit